MNPVKVLFICLGNICRSPAAEGAFLHLIKSKNLEHLFEVDSCGTGNWHIGSLPHDTTRKVAKDCGIDLIHRARQFHPDDFNRFDYLLAMDSTNFEDVEKFAKSDEDRSKLFLFRDFEKDKDGDPLPKGRSIPDPYYGGLDGFIEVQKMVTNIAQDFLEFALDSKGVKI
jgi:protein-tyrosine phosphatase